MIHWTLQDVLQWLEFEQFAEYRVLSDTLSNIRSVSLLSVEFPGPFCAIEKTVCSDALRSSSHPITLTGKLL
jgi:hypothetical protein